jgi:diguanylate cyclase (GGDEF)-like protein/PAS domain S-box-containing protein
MGIAREEVVGGTLQALQPHMFGQAQIGYLAERIASREPLVLNDFLHEMHGRLRRFDVRAVPVDDGMAVTWRDVTDRFDASQALTRSEAHYRVLLQEISDIVSFHDLTGGVQWISPALERVLGWPAEIANTSVMKMHPDDVEVVKAIREELRAGAQSVTRRIRLQHRDGSYRWMQTTTRAVRDEKDEPVSLVVISRDIQEQVAAEAALAASEARYRLLAEHATDVVYQVSDKGVTEWISDGVEPILGFTAQEFIGRPGLEFVVAEDRDYVTVMTRQVLSGQRGSVRFRMYTKSGGTRWVEATIHPVSDEAGVRIGVVGGWRDVQAEVEAREALDIRARTDDLTGLLNRREALSQLVHSLAQGDGLREQLAVAFCDVDGFKGINDSMGHSVGDRLLQSVADRIRACVRAGDTVARVGGDEILLILRGVRTVDDAMAIAEKVRLAVREPLYVQDQTVPISVSVGVTMAAADDDVDALVARADRAMYLAKEAGRDQVVRI